MFILRNIISGFLLPLPLSFLLSFLGLYLLWFTAKQKAGKILVSVGFVILVLFSYSFISDKLLRPLERKYSTFETKTPLEAPETDGGPAIKFVVVLGGGHISDPALPLISQIGKGSLVRLIEGIRIYRKYPGSRLLLSGGGVLDKVSEAEVMARVAREIGVPERDMVLESKSENTREEALFIKSIVGNGPFVLVTTASHIPRSMALFEKLGMGPIASPVGHSIIERQGLNPFFFLSKYRQHSENRTGYS